MKIVPFDIVCKEVASIIHCPVEIDQLLPDRLVQLLDTGRIPTRTSLIDKWAQFESGHHNFDCKSLTNIMRSVGLELDNLSEEITIIVDLLFPKHQAIRIHSRSLCQFVDEVFSNRYNQDFFQPEDYIFVLNKSKRLFIIHHEGLAISSL